MKLAESILELFYPSTCPGCGNHTSLKNLWCEKCIRQFWNPRMLSSSLTKYLCGCYTLVLLSKSSKSLDHMLRKEYTVYCFEILWIGHMLRYYTDGFPESPTTVSLFLC